MTDEEPAEEPSLTHGRLLGAAEAQQHLGILASTVRTWYQRRRWSGLYPAALDQYRRPLFYEADLLALKLRLRVRDKAGQRHHTMRDLEQHRRGAEMAKRAGRAWRWGTDDHAYGTELDEPAAVATTPATGADLVNGEDPAYAQIAFAALQLTQFGFDPADPDIARRAIAVGRRRHDRILESQAVVPQLGPFELRPGEVVYYMRIGNRVKIGWSANLPARLAVINPEELMVTEPGNRLLETVRHQQFAGLRTHGEWFRLDPRLVEHIDELRRIDQQEAARLMP